MISNYMVETRKKEIVNENTDLGIWSQRKIKYFSHNSLNDCQYGY